MINPIIESRKILAGIDQTETECEWIDDEPIGWWETSAGAEFGAKKLCELEEMLIKFVRQLSDRNET